MRLFSYLDKNNRTQIGVELPEGNYNLSRAFDIYQSAKRITQPVSFSFLQVMVELGYFSSSAVDKVLSDPWVQSKKTDLEIDIDLRFDLPIARPSKIICLGRNYAAHAKELNHEVPKEPVLFAKAPSTLIPHEADIVIPHWLEGRVDHEAELAVVIGKTARSVNPAEAYAFVAGYTILNDVTARTMQKEDIARNEPWFRSKSIDTFCPIGPFLVPTNEVPNPQELDIELTVNGQIRQQANTKDMIFPIPDLLAYISRFMTLNPGDIVATGTPEGVSPVQDGDVIEITVTGLGMLRNRVQKERGTS